MFSHDTQFTLVCRRPSAATITMTSQDLDRLTRLNKALKAVRDMNGSPDLEQALVKAIYQLENYGYGSDSMKEGGTGARF